MLKPRIEALKEKRLVGKHLRMSLAQNRTEELWGSFMPMIKTISNTISDNKFSLQVYPKDYFDNFDPTIEFEKWAMVEVVDFINVPGQCSTFVLQAGLYAVFDYKGSGTNSRIFEYIFSSWLPNSDYILDNRPHFEVLGEKYKNNHPESEEQIWIPVRHK
ncbi:GyrI-like domain-containing protein [Maribacter sp. ANRC-HE7]|uniref:GyrI-like domain-containing protein n=1 Tax=Maribacter aquimaris TaxID=2737171 RepID=A0ABR7UZU4_9FLAO|nr:GyrI-like domain-containing protein [Maribacter aquimaris]MBD0778048.1 GyrI-like domain-containing protein [Maribacter aquimaris]